MTQAGLYSASSPPTVNTGLDKDPNGAQNDLNELPTLLRFAAPALVIPV